MCHPIVILVDSTYHRVDSSDNMREVKRSTLHSLVSKLTVQLKVAMALKTSVRLIIPSSFTWFNLPATCHCSWCQLKDNLV